MMIWVLRLINMTIAFALVIGVIMGLNIVLDQYLSEKHHRSINDNDDQNVATSDDKLLEIIENELNRNQDLSIVYTSRSFEHESLDRFCLAKNIYHEARGESKIGQYAVAQVTLNRVKHSRWPSDICHVVMQPFQFSWANNRSLRWTHPNDRDWIVAQRVAADVLDNGARVQYLEGALFYHTYEVNPNWSSPENLIVQIGSHKFFERDLTR